NGEASYLFEEPVGLNASAILPELKRAGVTALKIEGRQRGRAYLTEVVGAFRALLDALDEGRPPPPTANLGRLAEGSQETLSAYRSGWR
ncbi:MAG: U32 family peptidase, partial [Rhodospirillales bacterium]|nr:U32 family peptidase [Rhodospirillales bacterium]